jgi:hypothetical protein
MDMPFLLRYALEGLGQIDTSHCKQTRSLAGHDAALDQPGSRIGDA